MLMARRTRTSECSGLFSVEMKLVLWHLGWQAIACLLEADGFWGPEHSRCLSHRSAILQQALRFSFEAIWRQTRPIADIPQPRVNALVSRVRGCYTAVSFVARGTVTQLAGRPNPDGIRSRLSRFDV